MGGKPARNAFAGADRIIHHIQWQYLLLVLDQAGWHTSKALVVPEGIHLLFLPSHSPELQPCERLWPLSNEGIANQSFQTLDDLEAAQLQRCVVLQNQPEVIRSHTHFHWWPPSDSKHQ